MPISLEDYEAQFGGLARSPVGQGPSRQYGWGDRFGASLDSAQAGLLGVGEAMGLDSLADARRRNQFESEYVRQAAIRDTGAPTRISEIDSVGSLGKGLAGLAIDSAPQLATSLAAGLVGGPALGLSTAGRLALGASAGAPFNLGDILQNQREEAGKTDLLSAAALTVPYTAADMLGLDAALSSGRLMKSGIRRLDDMQGLRGLAARGVVNTGINSLAEGSGETLQEFANQAGRIAVNPNQTMFNPEANDRYSESFLGGALLGGGLTAPFSTGRSRGYEPTKAPEIENNQTADLLSRPEFGLQSYGQGDGPQYLSPDQLIERDQALRANEADWTYMPGPDGQQVFAPQFPLGYQATRNDQAGLMSGVYTDVNGQPIELTTDELRNNRIPFIPLSPAELAMEKAGNLPGGFGQVNQYGEPIDFTPGVGEQGSLFADPAPTTGTRRNLVTEMPPLRQRIDQNLGISGQRYAQSGYPSQFEAAASEPTGAVVAGAEQGQIERPVTAIEDVQRRAGILAEEDRLKREAQAKYEQKVKAAQTAVFTQAELERGAGKQMPPNVLQAVTALNESPADAAVKQQVIGQLRSALTSNDKQSINAAVKAINSAAKAAVKDAQKLAQAQAAMAQTTPNAPPQAPNAKVVLPKTAPVNKAAAPAGQAPANTTAPAGVSGATGQAASVVSQPAPAANVAATGNAVAPGVFDPAKGAQEVTGDDGITRKFNAEGFDLESGKNWLAFASKDQKKAAAGQAIGAYYEATQGTGNPNVPVTTKKTRRVVGMTAAQAAKPGEAVKVSEVPVAEKTEKDKAREKLNDAAERMKAFFTKPTDPFSGTKDLNAGPAIPTELREILVDLAKAAIELGYHSVKDAVAHMRRSIIDMVGKEASDRIDDKHLIAARQEAGKYSPKGKAVYGGRVDLAMLHVAMEGRPDLEKAVRYYLLVDDDGTHLPADEVPTLTAAAQKAELGNSDHAQLSRINKLLGLTDSVIRRMRLDHYDETPFGEYGQEIEPENEIEAETNQLGVQQGFREGALSATDDDVEDYDGGELDGVDDETKAAVEARLMGVTPKASKSSVGHSTVDGLVQKTFGTPTNKWFKPFFVPGSDKLKPLAEVSDGDLGAALTALYSYVTTRTLQPRASKAMKEAAAKNQSLLNDLLNELERRQTAGAFDNKKLTRTLEARGEMVKAKAETAAQQAERERKKAQAEKDKEDRNAQQRDEYGREADPVDRREGDERLVPDLTGLDELPEAGTGGLADGEGDGVAEETQSDLGAAPISVTLRLNGETMKFKNAELSMELIRNKVDALTELLNCLRG